MPILTFKLCLFFDKILLNFLLLEQFAYEEKKKKLRNFYAPNIL